MIPNQDYLNSIVRSAQQYYEEVVRPGLASLQKFTEAFEDCLPSNWRELEPYELAATAKLVEESRLCLVWVPRIEIVRSMLAADEQAARLAVLVSSRDAVLGDLSVVLADSRGATVEGHFDACEFAAEAIAGARDSHFHAAQALAASGLGQVLHGTLGYPLLHGLGRAYKEFRDNKLEDMTMRLMKADLIELCTATALTDIEKVELDGFNRHGTQHGQRSFFSEANALAGMLLLVAWVREIKWLADNYPQLFAPRDSPA